MSEEVTLNDLLRKVLQRFEHEESPIGFSSSTDFDPSYPEVFCVVVKWYWNPEDLAKLLVEFFHASCQVSRNEGNEEVTIKRMWGIARAYRYWQHYLPVDFKGNPSLQQQTQRLRELMKENSHEDMADFISMDAMPEDLSRPISQTPRHNRDFRRPSLGFESISAHELAEVLVSLDYKLFRRVPFHEFCVYAHAAKPTDRTPRIDECIQLFNGITSWVVCNILREFTMVKRADIIEKFIDTTRCLYELSSYNTMLAVVGGLNHFAIRRLAQTWGKVDKSKKEQGLARWTNFFASQGNYATYRKQIGQLQGAFHIPVIGIVLKDLVAIDVQAKDMMNPQKETLNMSKYRLLWTVLSAIRQSQTTPPDIPTDLERTRVLRAAINQSCDLNDDALDELSLAREPRNRDSVSVNSAADLPSFQEWCEGAAPHLDPDSLQKHVKQMVDAVFRAYDLDQSGNITIREFDIISSNFPFIEHFSVLDQDNDGKISYDEMLQYFQSANSLLRERFKHTFVEHTFLGTPVCEHCKGMMKGIVRQGVRCKDCGISCHKHCKEHVVVDCSKRKEKKSKKRSQTANPMDLYCDDDISLKERLQRAEAARDALSAENAELQAKLVEANAKIQQLQEHMGEIRRHTIGFILEQMNTLNPQIASGTEV